MNKTRINEFIRKRINKKNRAKLVNKDFSLIASNCNGALILHDLGLRFNSPFVNLWIKPKDYIRMLANFKEYMTTPLSFIKEQGINYPIGLLKDVKIYFQHYESEEEAREKWNERKARINYYNLFVMFTERDGCTYEDLKAFDVLPFDNKVVFTKQDYPEIKSCCYIQGCESNGEVGFCYEYIPNQIGKKYFDQFDYVKWFNQGKVK